MLANIRNNYKLSALDIHTMLINPIHQAQEWMNEAIKNDIYEPTAMHLSTVSKDGKPSGRIVLLKEITEVGFVFFTNYSSKKGEQIQEVPYVALTLFWKEMERQIRIEGIASKISPVESDEYFNSRPIGSRIGAIVSPQSKPIPSRAYLEAEAEKLSKLPEAAIKRPENWGGYLVKPSYVEFWQGRENRMHDRIVYVLEGSQWILKRIAP